MRVLAQVTAYVDWALEFELGEPTDFEVAYAKEMVDYLISNYRREQAASSSDQGDLPSATARYKKSLEEFYGVANSGYDRTFTRPGKLGHKCKGPECCTSVAACKRKLVKGIFSVILRSKPGLAILAKWLKLGPVLDFLVASSLSNMLSVLFTMASRNFQFDASPNSDKGPQDNSSVGWHKMAGKHHTRSMSCVSSYIRHIHILILAIVVEPHPRAPFMDTEDWSFRNRPIPVASIVIVSLEPHKSFADDSPILLDVISGGGVTPLAAVRQGWLPQLRGVS